MNCRFGILALFLAVFPGCDQMSTGGGDEGSGADDGDVPGDDSLPEAAVARPNIVLVMTDDQDFRSVKHMPAVQARLADKGVVFKNYIATYSVCTPSRATALTGNYPHNHRVLGNGEDIGGHQAFLDDDDSTIATWLRAGGYRTALFGKYLNHYGAGDSTFVPHGWHDWHGFAGAGFYGYTMIEKVGGGAAVRRRYGSEPADYSTNVLARKAIAFVQRQESDDARPFFMYVAPFAPHSPAIAGPGDGGLFPGARYPRGTENPAFDEFNVADKPAWIRNLPRIGAAATDAIDAKYRDRLRSLAAVDDLVADLLDALAANGELERTVFVFTSDHGYHLGEHRNQSGKRSAYEQDITTPLIIRGPGIPAGAVRRHLIANNDLAPTLAKLAGVTAPVVDGASFATLLGSSPPPLDGWDRSYRILNRSEPNELGSDDTPDLDAVRTATHKYIQVGAFRELYELEPDPFELHNVHGERPAMAEKLRTRLVELRGCVGAACR